MLIRKYASPLTSSSALNRYLSTQRFPPSANNIFSIHQYEKKKHLSLNSKNIDNVDSVDNDAHPHEKWEYGTFKYGDETADSYNENDEKNKLVSLLMHLTPEMIKHGCESLSKYCTSDRFQTFESVLDSRTNRVQIVFENPANPNNVWASLRTLDTFGIQYCTVIAKKEEHMTPWRRKQMNQALGVQKYLTITQQYDTVKAINKLKSDNYRIICTDVTPNAIPFMDYEWNIDDRKVAVIYGNELFGVSNEARQLADACVYIPMKGFAESLNLSCAVSSLVTVLEQNKMLVPNLDEAEKNKIMLLWLARSVPGSVGLLKRHGINLSSELYETILQFSTKP